MWGAPEKMEEIRELWESAPKEEKKRLRKTILLDIHPDKNPGNTINAELVFKWFQNLSQ